MKIKRFLFKLYMLDIANYNCDKKLGDTRRVKCRYYDGSRLKIDKDTLNKLTIHFKSHVKV